MLENKQKQMMFKFNFFEQDNSTENNNKQECVGPEKEEIKYRDCEEISIPDERYQEIVSSLENVELNLFTSEASLFEASFLDLDTVKILGAELDIDTNSDLVNGVYEGGLKIWEATEDLINYLADDRISGVVLKNKKVLDLGCGSGILGILCLMRSAKVDFQDYNSEVLLNLTIPNVIVNIEGSDFTSKEDYKKCKFYAGDWDSFVKFADADRKYDIILTAETIYNPSSYRKLVKVLKSKLEADGVIFLAAKTFYFGVGGSLRDFEQFLDDDKTFKYETVFKVENDVFREVLKITHK